MTNKRRLPYFSLVALSIIFSSACLCGGGGAGVHGTNYDGVYSCGYSRAINGKVYISISGNTVNVEVYDGNDVYSGAGTLGTNGNSFSVVCTGGPSSITVTGLATDQDMSGHAQFTVDVSGGFTAGGTATFDGTSINAVFAGTYTGTFSGDSTGPFTMIVERASRTVIFKPTVGGVQFTGSGTIVGFNSDVTINLPPVDSGTYHAHFSTLSATQRQVSGTWSVTGTSTTTGTFIGTTAN